MKWETTKARGGYRTSGGSGSAGDSGRKRKRKTPNGDGDSREHNERNNTHENATRSPPRSRWSKLEVLHPVRWTTTKGALGNPGARAGGTGGDLGRTYTDKGGMARAHRRTGGVAGADTLGDTRRTTALGAR
jgi:hypothetical protein